jgi:hypothetical protein
MLKVVVCIVTTGLQKVHPEDYSLLGCKNMYFGESPAFWKKISPPSSGSKSKRSKRAV